MGGGGGRTWLAVVSESPVLHPYAPASAPPHPRVAPPTTGATDPPTTAPVVEGLATQAGTRPSQVPAAGAAPR
jgi:hypothetical protein